MRVCCARFSSRKILAHAHPIRPESYIEINNFYTVTIYEDEVVRMIFNLLGADGFRKGMDLYFERHDGQAVRCEDFVAAMEDATGVDLGQFRLWYSQSGTPELDVSLSHDADARTATLKVRQNLPPTPGQPVKEPMLIPFPSRFSIRRVKNCRCSSAVSIRP